MAVGFSTVAFDVLATDGTLPAPSMDERGWLTYSATIRLGSTADVATLRAKASTVTVKSAIGMRNGGTVVVESGDGVRTLTIPLPVGSELAYDAILTDLQPVANLLHADQWQADATWLLIAESA